MCEVVAHVFELEGRVDFVNGLPLRHKLLALDEKHILKIAFRNIIPHVFSKGRSSFTEPLMRQAYL